MSAPPNDQARAAPLIGIGSGPRPGSAGRIALALAVLALVGYGDFETGYEIGFYLFYAIPIAWLAWSAGLWWGLLISALSSAIWAWADIAAGHHYPHGWIIWERMTMNFATFAFIAFSFDQFRRNIAAKNRKVTQLEGILPVCIACKRINTPKGDWVDLNSYLEMHTAAKPEPCLCPDCRGARFT